MVRQLKQNYGRRWPVEWLRVHGLMCSVPGLEKWGHELEPMLRELG